MIYENLLATLLPCRLGTYNQSALGRFPSGEQGALWLAGNECSAQSVHSARSLAFRRDKAGSFGTHFFHLDSRSSLRQLLGDFHRLPWRDVVIHIVSNLGPTAELYVLGVLIEGSQTLLENLVITFRVLKW